MSEATNHDPDKEANKSELLVAAGLQAIESAQTDEVTGWPKRVVHMKTGAVLVLIPAGDFMMGSSEDGNENMLDEKLHRRVIRAPFYLGETVVTEAQWERLMERTPYGSGRGGGYPVVQVSWIGCHEFLRKSDDGMRLPSEAEWEYACRAGTATKFSFGTKSNPEKINTGMDLGGASKSGVVPCKTFPPNPWGLYEMHGNVWEWCQDIYAEYPDHGDERPCEEGPAFWDDYAYAERSGCRVIRGGSYMVGPGCSRSSHRWWDDPDQTHYDVGFRMARSIPGTEDGRAVSAAAAKRKIEKSPIDEDLDALMQDLAAIIDKARKGEM